MELLTVKEVSSALRIGKSTLYILWARGEGPKRIKIGRKILVTKQDLREYIKRKGETNANI